MNQLLTDSKQIASPVFRVLLCAQNWRHKFPSDGSWWPALHRLEGKGLILMSWMVLIHSRGRKHPGSVERHTSGEDCWPQTSQHTLIRGVINPPAERSICFADRPSPPQSRAVAVELAPSPQLHSAGQSPDLLCNWTDRAFQVPNCQIGKIRLIVSDSYNSWISFIFQCSKSPFNKEPVNKDPVTHILKFDFSWH